MGIVKGLSNIKRYNDEVEARREAAADRPQLTWFKIQDKESFKIRPLQELDEESPNYSEKNGVGFLAVEHANPKNYRLKGLCSIDEQGRCVGCERHRENFKAGWKQKSRLYLNVLVDEGNGKEPYVAILSQGNGPKSVTPTILEYAAENGTITNRWWKLTRNGKGQTDTSYTLIAFDPKDDVDVEAYEVFDLDLAVRDIPYEEQAEFYDKVWNASGDEQPKEESKTSVDEQW